MRVHGLSRNLCYPIVLIIVVQGMLVILSTDSTLGQEPVVVDIGGGRRTASWTLDDPSFYTFENVTLRNGTANLTLREYSWYESEYGDFLDGIWDENVTVTAEGNLTLNADNRNMISNGDFKSSSGWSFSNGTENNVIAEYDDNQKNAHLHYYGEAGPFWTFDDLDSISNWTPVGDVEAHTYGNSSDCCGGAGSLQVGWKPVSPINWGGAR
ncbi:MAG: hypothetical protein ACE5KV_06535, partial [Thermoplasmata archaeon]